jgi:hypothetical protein
LASSARFSTFLCLLCGLVSARTISPRTKNGRRSGGGAVFGGGRRSWGGEG